MLGLVLTGIAAFAPTLTTAHSGTEWQSRTIYQVLTDRIGNDNTDSNSSPCSNLQNYCGGTWKGIENKLDYISGMGFDAVWISPMLQNTDGSYHGYHFTDLYALNGNFGSEEDLKSLISAAHKRDIWVMLDVVGNHVGPVGTDYGRINPFNDTSHYHTPCDIVDWNNQEQVEMCRLADLPDLDQDNSYVRETLINWVSTLKADFDFDGLRIDTVPEVRGDFWSEFSSAAGMYCVGEVLNGDINYVAPYQNYMDGVLSYPLYYKMIDVFAHQQGMTQFESLIGPSGSYSQQFRNVNQLGTFVDNHDVPRFLYYAKGSTEHQHALLKNALTMTLFSTGIPIVYYGTEQGFDGGNDPANRESLWPKYDTNSDLYTFLADAVAGRKAHLATSGSAAAVEQVQRASTSDFYAFSRGELLVCLTNVGTDNGRTVTYDVTSLPFNNGDTVCNVLEKDEEQCLTVNDGKLSVSLQNGMPQVFAKK